MKTKTKHSIIVAVVIILLAGTSVYFVWLKNNQKPTVLGDVIATPTIQQVSNTQYGFRYSYPSDLYVDQETNAVTWLYKPSPFDFLNSPKTTEGTEKSAVQIQVYENTQNLSLSDWMKQQPKFPTFTTTQTTVASGVETFAAKTTSEDWKARATSFVKLQSAVLQLSFYANSDSLAEKDLPMFQAVLNSLQLDSQNQSVSTESYQNGTVGFLIDYPSNMKISEENYDTGNVSFRGEKQLEINVSFGGKPTEFKDLAAYAAKQDEANQVSKPLATKINTFNALVSTLSADTDNSYFYVQTSQGYFTIRVKKAKDISKELKVSASNSVNSFRVYELVSTKDWKKYTSSDGLISFQYPADASVENLSNGVQIQEGAVTFGVYSYKNLNLSILEWVDNAQLNKYEGSDSRHFSVKVVSEIDGKEALRTVDPVSNLKLATYVATKDTMYIAEMDPLDLKDAKSLATYNTILSTLKLK